MDFKNNKVYTTMRLVATLRLTGRTDTLIVWTEPINGIDMALSFQEAEGCAAIWYVSSHLQMLLKENVSI